MGNVNSRQNHYHLTSFHIPTNPYILANPSNCLVSGGVDDISTIITEQEFFGHPISSNVGLFTRDGTSDSIEVGPTSISFLPGLMNKEMSNMDMEMEDFEKHFVGENAGSFLMDWDVVQEITGVVNNNSSGEISESPCVNALVNSTTEGNSQLKEHCDPIEVMEVMAQEELQLCNTQFNLISQICSSGNQGKNSTRVKGSQYKRRRGNRSKLQRRKGAHVKPVPNVILSYEDIIKQHERTNIANGKGASMETMIKTGSKEGLVITRLPHNILMEHNYAKKPFNVE